jgi:radical SAM superfamily enzyme YgiQ (UPF0313 family)
MQHDLVLVQIPRMSPIPGMGVWLLQEQLEKKGYRSQVFDANLDLYLHHSESSLWQEIEQWGIQQKTLYQGSTATQALLCEIFNSWTKIIVDLDPKIVGISVFSIESRNWCAYLCLWLRRNRPDIKILLGGKGINEPGYGHPFWAEDLLKWNLCDFYLNGESENEIISFMENTSTKVNDPNGFFINDSLDRENFIAMTPELYKKYPLDSNWYEGLDSPDHPDITFVGSRKTLRTYSTRGCVKTCTFCDVHLLRPKFSIRSAQNIVDEIKYAIEMHDIREISFADEMINGSNKQFIEWMELLAKYLDANKIFDFKWRSQFGIKSRRSTPDVTFELTHRTGANLAAGIDHFSDDVLLHMQKKYTSDDIYYYLEKWNQYPIKLNPMMIVCGYPTETIHDYNILKNALANMSSYKKIIELIDLGNLCNIPIGSPLEKLPGMTFGRSRLHWDYQGNADLTVAERIRRRTELDEVIERQGFVNRKKRTYWLRIEAWLK